MADQTCEKELNGQLQALRARVDTLEDNVSTNIEATIQGMVATLLGFAGAGLVTSTAIMLANPFVLLMAAGMVSQGAANWADVIQLAKQLSGLDFQKIFGEMMLAKLREARFPQGLIDSIASSIQGEVARLEAELDFLMQNGGTPEEIQAALDALEAANNMYDSVTNAFEGQNRLSICKTASSIMEQTLL